MAPLALDEESSTKRRVSKKLRKTRREGHQPTMELPERFRDDGDDNEEDVRPANNGAQGFMNMNQSIFGLIAAAGSTVDFSDRFDGQSSDEDDEDADSHDSADTKKHAPPGTSSGAHTIVLPKRSDSTDKKEKHHRRSLSGNLLRSLPHLPKLASRSLRKSSKLRSSQLSSDGAKLPSSFSSSQQDSGALSPPLQSPIEEKDRDGARLAPVMSRMLEARAEMSSRPSFDLERRSSDFRRGDDGPSALASKLKEIFDFEQDEEVIQEYPCWLLQSVLMQGYMYITDKHICFYAYLPKKAHEVAKSGYLSKSGKRNPKFTRHWFRLKGDVLAYYRNASNLYFPDGQIDLRYAISASITDKDKDSLHFSVVTHQRTYNFKADSAPSAKEWVKSLQRVIFRSHNDGDSVKISLPLENVLDIEDSQMVEFADTCKIRVIDNDETYAIDEYFFSFFSFGKEAINALKATVEAPVSGKKSKKLRLQINNGSLPGSPLATSAAGSRSHSPAPRGELKSPKLRDHVKATLSPVVPAEASSPRASGDFSRASFDAIRHIGRRSMDLDTAAREASQSKTQQARRSFSASRSLSRSRRPDQSAHTDKLASSESYVQSIEDPSGTSGMIESSNESPSGSQILRGSEVFHSPTLPRRSASGSPAPGHSKTAHRRSQPLKSEPSALRAPGSKAGDTSEDGEVQSLQNLVKMGAYPLQRAGLFANYLNQTSKRMSNLLATESMGYVEKVSGMWKGGRKHYTEQPGLKTEDDEAEDDDDESQVAGATERFQQHFALPPTEKLQATYFGHILRVLPLYGKIYISDRHFCFRSLLLGTRTKLILPLKDIETVDKEKGFRFGYSGLVVVIRGHEEIFFEFNQAEARDDCAVTLHHSLEAARYLRDSETLDKEEKEQAEEAIAERDALNEARLLQNPEHELKLPQPTELGDSSPTILFDDPKASFLNFKPSEPMRITCLTIGSRGDVQPYIALCKGLLAEGHKPRIATHGEFKTWVESHGIEFAPIGGDPSELMQLCIQNGTFTWAFMREASSKFRGWLDELLASAWEACQGSDLLIESPSAMAGIHIAEALGIPYFRAFTMPWTRTRAYPHAFIMPEHKMGGAYNYVTYVMFDNVFWKATASQVNRWRRNLLGLPSTNLEKMQPNKVPFLYNFSPSVVAPPLDYSDWIRVTGYWFLDEAGTWTPPDDLREFIEQARKDGKKLVYVGFGSIIVPDPARMTQEVIDAVLKADVRCVLSKGWSDRLGDNKASAAPEVPLPPEIFQIKSAPHDWLFAQMDAAAHHGGSGTTGASLRAGIPTIVRPFFGDQFFFGDRLEDLGVGICLKKWGANSFARALWEATHSDRMIVKARVLGESIRKESGVETAIQSLYRDLEYSTSLIKSKTGKNAAGGAGDSRMSVDGNSGDNEDDEESWTFVGGGDEADLDFVSKRSSLGGGGAGSPEHTFHGKLESSQSSAGSRALGSKVLGGGSGVGAMRSPGGSSPVATLTHGRSSAGTSRLTS
ncbi:hypothetical protein Micbo1qcDRAFT_184542 [Microdochium bolleyi]|uniref:sterol 3beta-glucosyltransferase n=1 Tax=Microdochium bolleyi TaxID=196109 RepID=A0A136IWJ8_9PEZI|nr:hypothetical protein Micbo1qcDRAFT_184542 [Microdochium bolleyi]